MTSPNYTSNGGLCVHINDYIYLYIGSRLSFRGLGYMFISSGSELDEMVASQNRGTPI